MSPRNTVSFQAGKSIKVRNSNILDNIKVNLLYRGIGEIFWTEVRTKVQEWITDYNEMRPHKALNYKTPKETFNKSIINKNANFDWTGL